MPEPKLVRSFLDAVPSPLDGVAAMVVNAASEWVSLLGGLRGDDLDDWSSEYIRRTLPIMRTFFHTYFRADVRGLENIPDGPVLLVGNHSGGTMIADTFVFGTAFYERFGPERRFHQLAHDVAARLPGLNIRPYGTVRASHENATKAFEKGAAVLVYPGGDYETFRPSWHSDQIEFDSRKGFVKLALAENVPIVPVVSIGGQETALFLTRGERAARLIGLDRFLRIKVLPVSLGPPLGISVLDLPPRLPLPAKIEIEVRPPVDLHERFGPSPSIDRAFEAITAEMQGTLDDLAEDRAIPVVG